MWACSSAINFRILIAFFFLFHGVCVCVWYDFLNSKYPLVHIQGEESTTFTNGLGESVDLQITDNEENTLECLVKVLNGDTIAAELLVGEVHRNVICEHGEIDALPDLVSIKMHSL